mmetsp:Transcript_77807/g.137170  ORF Transcript_77807/g.137170 Transcript_77807/m.137170 type:complete len:252 (-) Transcript_77807:312-1067(-)
MQWNRVLVCSIMGHTMTSCGMCLWVLSLASFVSRYRLRCLGRTSLVTSLLTASGTLTVNISVCRSSLGGRCSMRTSSLVQKSDVIIRSHSSNTSILIPFILSLKPFVSWQCPTMRPGVAQMMVLSEMSASSSRLDVLPPINPVTFTSRSKLKSLWALPTTCRVSSRVGIMINECSCFRSRSWANRLNAMGRRYASVFPVPVRACPTTSIPSIARGTQAFWTSVRCVTLNFSSRARLMVGFSVRSATGLFVS